MSQLPRNPKPRLPRMPRRPGYYQSPGAASTDVTVYQGGQAVVREQRTLDLKEGATEVFLEGMPTQFQPDSLTVLGYDGPGKLTLGAPLALSFPREKLNVFDARTGLRM